MCNSFGTPVYRYPSSPKGQGGSAVYVHFHVDDRARNRLMKPVIEPVQVEKEQDEKGPAQEDTERTSADLSSDDDESHTTRKRQLSFGTITVRRYDVTLGDNPSCAKGVPVSLDWTFQEDVMLLDEYESVRDSITSSSSCSSQSSFYLTKFQRYQLLMASGFTPKELRKAKKQVKVVQRNRRWTNMWHHMMVRWSKSKLPFGLHAKG